MLRAARRLLGHGIVTSFDGFSFVAVAKRLRYVIIAPLRIEVRTDCHQSNCDEQQSDRKTNYAEASTRALADRDPPFCCEQVQSVRKMP